MRELSGWIFAAAISLISVGAVAASPRAELLFRDGDSLVVAMLARSVLSGQPLDWAMSSVLFVPESAAFTALDIVLPLGTNGVLAASAVVNLLALYGAIRLVAGRSRPGHAPVTWSLLALGAFGASAMTEVSSSRDALDLASLQATTTYYSATVVAVVLAVGLVRRILDRESRSPAMVIVLAAVALVSTFSNPLFIAWGVAPLVLVLAVLAVRAPQRTRILMLSALLLGAAAAGMLARIPFAAWIANTGAGYAQPSHWQDSAEYYAGLLGDRIASPFGLVGLLITVALLTLAVVRTTRSPDVGARVIATVAWATPLIVVVGAVVLGTHASRYLQPLAFAPVLALVAWPTTLRVSADLRRRVAAVAGVLLLIGGGLSVPQLAAAASAPDADLACVTDWVEGSGRTGAGQFWTVRLPKLHLDDPSQLVQVDHRLNAYAWLVNRHDADVGEVSFLVEDSQTVPWELPQAVVPTDIIDCGRYTIRDFGTSTLPIGPAHS